MFHGDLAACNTKIEAIVFGNSQHEKVFMTLGHIIFFLKLVVGGA
jgi:hypothetical protein